MRRRRGAAQCPAHHDPYDIFSPDDGFSVFVTPGGARWKPDLTHGYNVALAGLKRDLSNLADCFDRVRDSIINRIKANGRVNNILCKIMIPSVNFVTNYKVDRPLVYPSIITLTALGNVYIEPKEGMHFQPVMPGRNDLFTDKLTKAMFQADSGWQGQKQISESGISAGHIRLRGRGVHYSWSRLRS
jgi:hypothetical protein